MGQDGSPATDQFLHLLFSGSLSIGPYIQVCRLFLLSKFPYAYYLMAGANAIYVASSLYAYSEGKPPKYWLHSLSLVVLGSCGGGMIAGPLIGEPAGFIASADLLIPAAVLAWYATHYLGLQKFLMLTPVKLVWYTFLSLYKTHTVIDMVNLAKSVLKPKPFYSIPFLGPVMIGTLTGCFGAFLPFDKALDPISAYTPWAIQASFMTAFFYHAMVNDSDGVVGVTFRSVFGTYSEYSVRIIIAIAQILSAYIQVLFSKDANLFTPLHKVAYLVFQVTGPTENHNTKKTENATVGWDFNSRQFLEKLLEISRYVAVVAVILGHIYISHPIASLSSGQLLLPGQSIGSCQIFSTIQGCKPYILTFDKLNHTNSKDLSYQLNTYKATGKSFHPSASDVAVWSYRIDTKISPSVQIFPDAVQGLVLGTDGVLHLISRSEKEQKDVVLWSSSSRCPLHGKSFLSLNGNGQAVVNCDNDTVIPIF